jgi:hypothetical protein
MSAQVQVAIPRRSAAPRGSPAGWRPRPVGLPPGEPALLPLMLMGQPGTQVSVGYDAQERAADGQ